MKIAIPVDNNSVESKVCKHFGRAPYFLIYNTETDESTFFDNEAAVSQGGAGIKAAQTVVDQKANVLITPQCGLNAAEVIKSANIVMYQSANYSIDDNIKLFSEGKLSLLDDIHPGYHNK